MRRWIHSRRMGGEVDNVRFCSFFIFADYWMFRWQGFDAWSAS